MHRCRIVALLLFTALGGRAAAESAGGVSWTAPAGWKAEPARPMRVATYKIAAVAPDSDEAELAIFFFGAGQGGSADDNVKRWAGQFAGNPPATKKLKVGGLQVTRVEIEGTYASSMGPSGPTAQPVAKPGYALSGAIVEGGEAPVFFKLIGPRKTVAAARGKLDKLLSTLKK